MLRGFDASLLGGASVKSRKRIPRHCGVGLKGGGRRRNKMGSKFWWMGGAPLRTRARKKGAIRTFKKKKVGRGWVIITVHIACSHCCIDTVRFPFLSQQLPHKPRQAAQASQLTRYYPAVLPKPRTPKKTVRSQKNVHPRAVLSKAVHCPKGSCAQGKKVCPDHPIGQSFHRDQVAGSINGLSRFLERRIAHI